MTSNEFDFHFMPDFKSHFPEVGMWLSRQVGADGRQDSGYAVLLTWFDAIRDCSLDDAMDATARIHRGDIARPDGWSGYPGLIRRICRDHQTTATTYHQPKIKDGQEVYTCPLCRDASVPTVTVLAPVTVRQLLRGTEWSECTTVTGRPGIVTVAVACSCSRGQAMAERNAKQSWHVYDPLRMFPADCVSRHHEPDGLREWLERVRAMRVTAKPTYSTALAAWNEPEFD